MPLVSLDLISFTIYAKGAQAAISQATLIALTGCYSQLSLFCYFEQFGNNT